jgi:hypothetical protein
MHSKVPDLEQQHDRDHLAAVSEMYPDLCVAVSGYRKDEVASALVMLLAEILLMGVSEKEGLHDAKLVMEALETNISKVALARAPVGVMN